MNSPYRIFNKKLKRKSQLTLSIIAGLLILITVVAIFYITEYITIETVKSQQVASEEFKKDVESVRNYLEKCVRDTGYFGLFLLGQQGGYTEVPVVINYNSTSYWYLDQANIQPTLEEIRERLKNYINENVPVCSDFEIFRGKGFEITAGNINSLVEFGTENVLVNLTYPITIQKNRFRQEFSDFYEIYNIRFRRTYELASQIINRHFEPRFDVYHPLDLVNSFDFDAKFNSFDEDNQSIMFVINDNTRVEYGVNYEFRFASRFNRSQLPSVYSLQPNSSFIPLVTGFVVYSTDRLAQLNVTQGTLVNLNGDSVEEVKVKQFYPNLAIRRNVPVSNDNGVIGYSDIIWRLTNPVYAFTPDGTKFNNQQKLVIYWDDEVRPNAGEVGILKDDGTGWRPIDSTPDYTNHLVWTDLQGFSNYTAVDCGNQGGTDIKVTETVKPHWACWILFLTWFVEIVLWIWSLFGLKIKDPYYSFGKSCIVVTPSCDQETPTIKKTEKDGSGQCYIMPAESLKGGRQYMLCAKVKKCDNLIRYICKKCSVSCGISIK